MIVARRNTMGGRVALSAKDYIRDSIIVQYHHLENSGFGKYDQNATVWKDLSGNGRDGKITGSAVWNKDGLNVLSVNGRGLVEFDATRPASHTVEIVCRIWGNSRFGRFLAENQWMCFNDDTTKKDAQYYIYGWGVDSTVASNKKYDSHKPSTFAIRDNRTVSPEIFNDGVFVSSFNAPNPNIGSVISYLGNRATLDRGLDVCYLAVRIHGRVLTDEELAYNAKLDREIFGFGFETTIIDSVFIRSIGGFAFSGCAALTTVGDLSACTSIGVDAFYGCGLEEVYAPLVETLESRILQNCPVIKRVLLPNVREFHGNNQSFGYQCPSLEVLEFGQVEFIKDSVIFGTNVGVDNIPDEDGVKFRFVVKNTMESLRSVRGDTGSFPWDMPNYGKFVCSDGYITKDGGVWTNHENA